MARKRAENREGSLGHPGFVKPVFTKDSKYLGKRKISLGLPRDCDTRTHLKKVRPLGFSIFFCPPLVDLSHPPRRSAPQFEKRCITRAAVGAAILHAVDSILINAISDNGR
ncbi:hypothetical protein TNCV_3512001 [Trichonephila clavipes]|nr:hypothetical protein TNCV_3512001 [Trichonephila clavipes]